MENSIEKKTLFGVMRLCKGVEQSDPFTGEKREIKILGIEGFMPIFATIEEAKEASCNGEYQIISLNVFNHDENANDNRNQEG